MKQSVTCDTSELDSNDENEKVVRGKRTPKPIHLYGDTEDSDREPAPKKAPTPSKKHQPTSGPSLTSQCNQPASVPSCFAQPPLAPPTGPSSFSTPPQQLFQSPYNCSSQISYTDLSLGHPPPRMSCDGLAISYRERATEVFMPSLNMGRSGKDPIICTPAELHMLTLMENMKQQITQLSMNMSVVMARTAAAEPVVEMLEEISLPLTSLEEVDHFEGWLKNPANAAKKQHLVGMLASIGGRDTKHLIFNILAHIFADSVAKSINWKGMNNKKKFSDMATKSIMARAVRKNRMSDKATDTEINQYSIRYFNLASDRGAGRRARPHPTNEP